VQQGVKNSSGVKRHIIAALVLPGFIAYLYLLPPFPYFLALLITVGVTALWEFFTMYKVPARLYVPGVLIGGTMLYVFCLYPAYMLEGIAAGLFILLVIRLFFAPSPPGAMSEIGPLAAGLIYVTGFLYFQWLIRTDRFGMEHIFLLYLSVWFSDSMAYYVGSSIGRKKLCPSISPKKTVEGAFGSVIGGILGVLTAKYVFSLPHLSIFFVILTGTVMGLSAMTGDLIESMFKRDAGVKDSSGIIPGHGGILDKLDGLLVAGPVLYFIVRFF